MVTIYKYIYGKGCDHAANGGVKAACSLRLDRDQLIAVSIVVVSFAVATLLHFALHTASYLATVVDTQFGGLFVAVGIAELYQWSRARRVTRG